MSDSTTNDTSVSPEITPSDPEPVPVPARKFVSHLKQYPLAVAAKRQLMIVPLMETVWNMGSNVASAFWCDRVDNLADKSLSQVDRFVPGLQKIEPVDITNPVMVPYHEAVGLATVLTTSTETVIQDNITKPAKKVATEVGEVYNKTLYTENGKNKILTPVDPLMVPINNKMVEVVDHFKPNTLKPTSEESTSEFQRGKHIVWNFIVGKKQPESQLPVDPVEPVDTVVSEAN